MAKIVLHQKMTQDVVLSVFGDKSRKLAEIPMGQDVDQARKDAAALMAVFKEADDFTDET